MKIIRKYNYVLQEEKNDCSIASLMTILMHFNIKPDREKLLKELDYKKDNYTAYDIKKMSKVYGLNCEGRKIKLTKINTLPVIAHVIENNNYFHFIVIFNIDRKRRVVTVMDPAIGLKTMSFNDFESISTNIFLTFKKTKEIDKDQRLKNVIKSIVFNNKTIIIKTLLLSLLFIILSLLFNYYLMLVLSNMKNLSFIKILFITFIIICIIKNSINFIKNKLILKLNLVIDEEITKKVINHLFSLPYRYFNSKSSGNLISIIGDIEVFKDYIIRIFILTFVDLFLLILIIIYIFFLNFIIGIYLTLFLLLILIITNSYKYKFNDNFSPFKVRNIDYNSNLIEVLNSMETIKNLNLTSNLYNKLINKYKIMKQKEKSYNGKIYNYEFIRQIVTDIFYVVLILLGVFLFSNSNSYNIVLYSSLFYMIISFLRSILEAISNYKVEEFKVNRVLDLLNEEGERGNDKAYREVNKIIYKDVVYKDILKNINLEINKGDKVFITGPSGIGKSTLIKLLLRYFDITNGSILIDNINISEYSPYFIKEKITYCSQNENLFKGSIKDNLSIINSKESIEDVSKLTLLDSTLKKKNIDLNFLLEEFGNNLSGGEKKKIILTRALLKMEEVLILDEALNEISIEEEAIILNNIFNKYKDKIIIVISHRTNNMNLFNKKYILKGDDIIEIK